MATLKEQDIVLTTKDVAGNTVIQMPITRAANVEDLTSTCLSLAGGTMTGAIKTSVDALVSHTDDASAVRMDGGTGWDKGASLVLYGKDETSYKGQARIRVTDGTNTNELIVKPDGTATWGGNDIITTKYSGSKSILNSVTSETGSLQFYGGTAWNTGSLIGVYGKSHTNRPGWLYLSAHDGTNTATLVGKPDGSLTWGGKNVVRSVNGTAADASGNVKVGGTSAYQIPFATCSTAKNTFAKVATITNGASFSLVAGAMIAVKYTYHVESLSTLNVNSTGAKTVKRFSGWVGNSAHSTNHEIYHSNNVYLYVYDGTYWNEFVYAYSYDDSDDGD